MREVTVNTYCGKLGMVDRQGGDDADFDWWLRRVQVGVLN